MTGFRSHSRTIAISALSLPIGLFAAYIAYLIVPEILRIVVPTVVQGVLNN